MKLRFESRQLKPDLKDIVAYWDQKCLDLEYEWSKKEYKFIPFTKPRKLTPEEIVSGLALHSTYLFFQKNYETAKSLLNAIDTYAIDIEMSIRDYENIFNAYYNREK